MCASHAKPVHTVTLRYLQGLYCSGCGPSSAGTFTLGISSTHSSESPSL